MEWEVKGLIIVALVFMVLSCVKGGLTEKKFWNVIAWLGAVGYGYTLYKFIAFIG